MENDPFPKMVFLFLFMLFWRKTGDWWLLVCVLNDYQECQLSSFIGLICPSASPGQANLIVLAGLYSFTLLAQYLTCSALFSNQIFPVWKLKSPPGCGVGAEQRAQNCELLLSLDFISNR